MAGARAGAGAVGVRSSSFLADAVRETATNHCIDRVVNGSLDGTVAVVSAVVSAQDACQMTSRSRAGSTSRVCFLFKGRPYQVRHA